MNFYTFRNTIGRLTKQTFLKAFKTTKYKYRVWFYNNHCAKQ